ncbi:hypothetical protein [Curtobacterium poinsettiae]|uniref:Uncharacterized protein n=1 Tax=Curtobacterium poinsettiae TaxID=159612 RepID=A0ABT3S0Y2_9MICO|nr:hypothetical protein [Curtobacterium flaccumfaciens]MBT1608659.1 hypothetical protein [Curtobacterium flaccumfaciens pv. poinsettiae]MCX2848424.1 hypothetical protein [Curtobacterium flaccumfaciens pv. poinsettiae]UXN19012.1 hypothetical protein N8D78_02555 [Curtobacterium flaccumfaciens pv. poinsettiae]
MTRTFILRRPDRPQVVTVSFVLWLVWVVACIAATVLQFWTPDAAVGPAPVIAGIVALVLWALVTWAVFRTAAGSRVARIVLVVVAGFRAVLSITGGQLDVLTIALSVVAAVLLFLPTARPYFAARAAWRTGHGFDGTGVSGPSRASRPDPDPTTDADRS